MDANGETLMLLEFVRGFRRAFEKEAVALQSIQAAVYKEEEIGGRYMDGVDMGAFAASGVANLEFQVQGSLQALEELLGQFIPERTMVLCRKPLLRIGAEDHLLDILEKDIKTIRSRTKALQELETDLLDRDPEEISASLPERVRQNIADTIDRELGELGRS